MSGGGTLDVSFRGALGKFALNAAFRLPAHGVTALFGPSGCGKTTVLRCIAGLHHIREGFCTIDGDVWQRGQMFRPAHRRPIGMVFQEASLFAHLSVRRNLLYGAPKPHRPDSFAEITALLGLTGLLDRSPQHLSGGERQRVAIGRALLSQPRLLLMDEPLSALDRASKDEILPYLERLQEALALPMIYVSHDMAEIERLADHLVLMQAGQVLASGPLAQLQADPNLPLARGRDPAVSLDAIVTSYDPAYGLARLLVEGGAFLVPAPALARGERQRLRIQANDVSLARQLPGPSTISNILSARILNAAPSGPHEITTILGLGPDGAGARLLARITLRSWDTLGLAQGMQVHAQIKSVALISGRHATSD